MTRRRNSRMRLKAGSLAAFLICSALGRTVLAEEDPNPQTTAAARALAVDGLKLAKAGQCEEAIDKLDKAEKLRHAPIVLGKLGECLVSVGRLVEGTEALRKMLREPLPADASPTLAQAYEKAQSVLQEAKQRIPGLTINVTGGANPREIKLRVDGNDVPATVLGVELPLDPGRHIVEVSAPGFFKASAEPRVEIGDKQTVSLELKRDPNAPKEEPKDASQATPAAQMTGANEATAQHNGGSNTSQTPPQPTASHGSNTWAYISYGVGAVGLGVGLIYGRAAMQDKTNLDSRCPDNVCSKSDESALNSARTKGTISTIGFGVGAAGVALGTVLLLTSGSSASSSSASALPAHPGARRLAMRKPETRLFVGLGGVRVSGEF